MMAYDFMDNFNMHAKGTKRVFRKKNQFEKTVIVHGIGATLL